jgi:DNA-binding beta-propeller fold protein YncE
MLCLVACGDDGSPAPMDETSSGDATDTSTSVGMSSTGVTTSSSTDTSSGSESSDSGPASSSESSGTESGTGGPDTGLELLVCSFVADAVHRFDLDDGSFLGDLEPARDLDGALGIVVGPDDAIYVASEESNMVLRYAGAGLERFIWDDPATDFDETGGLLGPGAVLFGEDGQLYVSSFDSDAILRYDGSTGAFDTLFVPSGSGGLDGPDAGMVFGPDGNLYVPGFHSNTIARFDAATGNSLGDFTPTDMLDQPRTLVFEGDHLYVTNEGSSEVLRFDATSGDFVDVFVEAGAGGLGAPSGMVFAPDGVLHVASIGGNTVLRFDETGEPLPTLVDAKAAGIAGPTHITIAPAIE